MIAKTKKSLSLLLLAAMLVSMFAGSALADWELHSYEGNKNCLRFDYTVTYANGKTSSDTKDFVLTDDTRYSASELFGSGIPGFELDYVDGKYIKNNGYMDFSTQTTAGLQFVFKDFHGQRGWYLGLRIPKNNGGYDEYPISKDYFTLHYTSSKSPSNLLSIEFANENDKLWIYDSSFNKLVDGAVMTGGSVEVELTKNQYYYARYDTPEGIYLKRFKATGEFEQKLSNKSGYYPNWESFSGFGFSHVDVRAGDSGEWKPVELKFATNVAVSNFKGPDTNGHMYGEAGEYRYNDRSVPGSVINDNMVLTLKNGPKTLQLPLNIEDAVIVAFRCDSYDEDGIVGLDFEIPSDKLKTEKTYTATVYYKDGTTPAPGVKVYFTTGDHYYVNNNTDGFYEFDESDCDVSDENGQVSITSTKEFSYAIIISDTHSNTGAAVPTSFEASVKTQGIKRIGQFFVWRKDQLGNTPYDGYWNYITTNSIDGSLCIGQAAPPTTHDITVAYQFEKIDGTYESLSAYAPGGYTLPVGTNAAVTDSGITYPTLSDAHSAIYNVGGKTVSVSGDTVTVKYPRNLHTVSISVVNGTGSVSNVSVRHGANSAAYSFSADTGYTLPSAYANGYTFTNVTADQSITVTCTPIDYTIHYAYGTGSEAANTARGFSPAQLPADNTAATFNTSVQLASNVYAVVPASDHSGTYTFSGWYSDAACTTGISSVIVAGNTTVYGKWTFAPNGQYTVSYEWKPNDQAELFTTNNENELPAGETLYSVQNHTVSTATYSDIVVSTGDIQGTFTFGGWFTDAACTTAAGMTVSAATTIYGKWTFTEATKYAVTYTVSGDVPAADKTTATPAAVSYYKGAPVTIAADLTTTAAVKGEIPGTWTFGGWKIGEKDAADFDMGTAPVAITGAWSFEADKFDLTASATGAQLVLPNDGAAKVSYGEDGTVTFRLPEGYDPATIVVKDGDKIVKDNSDNKTDNDISADDKGNYVYIVEDVTGARNVTVTASKYVYTVTLKIWGKTLAAAQADGNNDRVSTYTELCSKEMGTVEYDGSYNYTTVKLSELGIDGLTFVAGGTIGNLGGSFFDYDDVHYKAAGLNYSEGQAKNASGSNVTGNKTINIYLAELTNIFYNDNTEDAVTNMPENNSNVYESNRSYTIGDNKTPVREGYTFIGWATSENAEESDITFSEIIDFKDETKGVKATSYEAWNKVNRYAWFTENAEGTDVTLYAIWQKNTYDVDVSYVVAGVYNEESGEWASPFAGKDEFKNMSSEIKDGVMLYTYKLDAATVEHGGKLTEEQLTAPDMTGVKYYCNLTTTTMGGVETTLTTDTAITGAVELVFRYTNGGTVKVDYVFDGESKTVLGSSARDGESTDSFEDAVEGTDGLISKAPEYIISGGEYYQLRGDSAYLDGEANADKLYGEGMISTYNVYYEKMSQINFNILAQNELGGTAYTADNTLLANTYTAPIKGLLSDLAAVRKNAETDLIEVKDRADTLGAIETKVREIISKLEAEKTYKYAKIACTLGDIEIIVEDGDVTVSINANPDPFSSMGPDLGDPDNWTVSVYFDLIPYTVTVNYLAEGNTALRDSQVVFTGINGEDYAVDSQYTTEVGFLGYRQSGVDGETQGTIAGEDVVINVNYYRWMGYNDDDEPEPIEPTTPTEPTEPTEPAEPEEVPDEEIPLAEAIAEAMPTPATGAESAAPAAEAAGEPALETIEEPMIALAAEPGVLPQTGGLRTYAGALGAILAMLFGTLGLVESKKRRAV